MSAYIIFIRNKMKDPQAYEQYVNKAAPTLAPYGGEVVVLNGEHQLLEGSEDIDGSVVLKFPSMDSARAWYNSEEYAQMKPLRLEATEGRAFLIAGMDQ